MMPVMPRPQLEVLPRCVTVQVVVLMSNMIQVKAPALEAGPGPGAHGHHHYDDALACWGWGLRLALAAGAHFNIKLTSGLRSWSRTVHCQCTQLPLSCRCQCTRLPPGCACGRLPLTRSQCTRALMVLLPAEVLSCGGPWGARSTAGARHSVRSGQVTRGTSTSWPGCGSLNM
jgi:hypothetical protein